MYSTSLIDKRNKLGWSCKKLAEMADVPLSAILRMERGIGFWEDYATKLDKTLTKALAKAVKIAKWEKELRDLQSQPPKEKTSKWSLKYESCVICGTVKRRHVAKGLCTKCYQIENENRKKQYVRKKGYPSHKLSYLYLVEQYLIKEMSLGDIAKECACTRQFVYKKLKSYNIPSRGKSSARELALKRHKLSFERIDENGQKHSVTLRKIEVDENFFSSWSPEMAWVLGLIFSDGNLFIEKRTKDARISISQKETELLDKVKFLMNCNARLYHSPRKVYNDVVSGELYTLKLQNKKIFSDLISLGLVENKSLTVDFPNIPKEYARHFIRGCWDGDGSVFLERRKRLSTLILASFVSGSLSFINGMLYELEKGGLKRPLINTSTYKRKNPIYSFKFHTTECKKLYHYLYENVPAEQYLERKYNVFKNYFGPC
jgi:hypothetical protein